MLIRSSLCCTKSLYPGITTQLEYYNDGFSTSCVENQVYHRTNVSCDVSCAQGCSGTVVLQNVTQIRMPVQSCDLHVFYHMQSYVFMDDTGDDTVPGDVVFT